MKLSNSEKQYLSNKIKFLRAKIQIAEQAKTPNVYILEFEQDLSFLETVKSQIIYDP